MSEPGSRPATADTAPSPTAAEVPKLPMPSEAPLQTLFLALPSVQRYGEDFQLEAPALDADLTVFLRSVFCATRVNADAPDADAAVASLRADLPEVPPLASEPPPLLVEGTEDGEAPPIGTISREYFEKVIREFVAPRWLPPGQALIDLKNPPSPPSPPKAADADAAAEAENATKAGEETDKKSKKKKDTKSAAAKAAADAEAEAEAARAAALAAIPAEEWQLAAQAEALVEAIVDDRVPRVLLGINDVITMPLAQVIPVELKSFTRVVQHPAHPACYDTMWEALGKEESAPHTTTLPEFTRWLFHWLSWCSSNMTEARADIAARTHWLDATASTGELTLGGFITTARMLARLYVQEDGDTFFVKYVDAVQAAKPANGEDLFYAVKLGEGSNRAPLVDPTKLFVHDELATVKHEDAVSRKATENRLLVLGLEGSGKTTLGREVAKNLGAVFVDVFDLALAAIDAGEADDLGAAIKAAVDDDKPIDLPTQSKLVRRCLSRSATQHRGYVFGDVPAVVSSSRAAVEQFIKDCDFSSWPTAVVDLRVPSELYASWRNDARGGRLQAYNDELAIRQAEADEAAAKVNAEREREERIRFRQEKVERQAKIDAGEIEPTDEDKAFAEAGGIDSLPEEPEPEPEVDEDGNPLEPEAIAAREAAKQAAVARRKLLAELRRQIAAGREVDAADAQVHPLELTSWSRCVDQCRTRGRVLPVAGFDDANECATYVVDRLGLVPSVVPELPAVPAESLEGIEAGPDGDQQLAELQKTALQEAGMGPSPWDSYCPVTKFEEGVLVQGSWAYSCHFRGFMYCFASKAKLNQFLDSPLPYITQDVNDQRPLLLLARTRDALVEAGIAVADVEAQLALQLNLTPSDVHEYFESWGAYEAEVARRDGLRSTRLAADQKALKAREERVRKQREAELKKAGKKEKKKKKETTEEEAAPAEVEAKPEDAEDAVAAVLTTEQALRKDVDAAVTRKANTLFPHLVSGLQNLSDAEVLSLLERRKLPETVVVLEYAKPKAGDEEEEEAAEDEEEEAEPEPEPELDEDGNPIPRKPKTPPPFDQNDPKMYKKLLGKLTDEFALTPDDEPAAPAEGEGEGKAPLPRQAFAVKTLNVYGMSAADVVASIVNQCRPVQERATLPQDGEDLQLEDDAEEENEDVPPEERPNPLLNPGRKAIHQYGQTLKYCPVTLHETGVLVQGDPANWLSYSGGRYTFVTPESMERFRINPDRYLPSVPPALPAPRLWLLGVPFGGKRTLAAALQEQYGIPPFWLDPGFLVELIAAASNPDGGVVRGLQIPATDPATSTHLAEAIAIAHELKRREEDEQAQLKAKDDAIAQQAARDEARDNGEEIDELDEAEEEELQKLIDFEPEDEEAKGERVAREQRRMAAALTRVEPYESAGYVLVGRPETEQEVEQLFEFNAIPEAVISLKLSPEAYVARRVDEEMAKRVAEYRAQLAAAKAKRRQILRKQRAAEIARWRKRNIGGDDDGDAEEDELPEDPEEPQLDTVKSDLEGQYETELGNVQTVLGMLPERRVPVVEVNGDWGRETVFRTTEGALAANLTHRRSMLENPLVVTFDQALALVHSGRKYLSCFRFTDPVKLARERSGAPPEVELRRSGRGLEEEDEIPEPEPEPPKPKRMKTITRENPDTGDEEEVEVTDDEPEEEEAPAEDEAEEELEAEPELGEDELDEMRQEHDAKMRKLRDAKKMRACVLRNRVYFFENDSNLLMFLTKGPLSFWDQAPPLPPAPSVVAVMDDQVPAGPFFSTERPRSMAFHVAHNLGAVYLDAAKLLKWASRTANLPTLRQDALKSILAGDRIPDEVLCTVLACRLLCSDVSARGAVLSNLPRSDKQLNALLDNGVTIHKVIVYPKLADDGIVRTIDSLASVSTVITFERFSNAALVESHMAVVRNKRNRQHLAMCRALGFPARIHNASVPNDHLRSTRSIFQTYCPYTWVRDGRLIDSLGDTQHAVEYCGKQYYFSSDEYVEVFMRAPHELSGERESVSALPTVLPVVLTERERSKVKANELEHAGCCPVTLYETRDNKGLRGVAEPKAVQGDPNLLIEYAGKTYALADDAAVAKFLRQPWVFVEDAVLPLAHRMPFDPEEVKAQSTELYVKRMLYEDIARAMLAVADTRPKFPDMSPQDSALKFMSLFLKAHNGQNTEHRRNCYEQNYGAFAERATLYRDIALEPPEGEEALAVFRQRCDTWDAVQDDPECWREYQHPQRLTEPPVAAPQDSS